MHKTPNEVIVRFTSGLGNQLFQLACGLATARSASVQLRADTTWYRLVAHMHRPLRQFRLHLLQISLEEAFRGPRRWAVGFAVAAFDRWARGRKVCEYLGAMDIVQESAPMTVQKITPFATEQSPYLNGYWQTADHYLASRHDLLPMLRPRDPLSEGARFWLEKIKSRKTAFLHVRRGDYETLTGSEGLLPPSYYRQAAEALRSQGTRNLHWVVFTEDEAWAAMHLRFLQDFEIVRYESTARDIEDMQLMAACASGVVANSSYSWWGAAIGEQPGRPIVAPDKYWRSARHSTEAWRLPTWLAVGAWS